jgi:RHS repeat-associated protein
MKSYFSSLVAAAVGCLLLASQCFGQNGNDNPTGVTGEFSGSVTTGGQYDPYTGNAKRVIDDLVVTGSIDAYPLKWTRILNTRGGGGAFGQGSGWTHSYNWALFIRPPQPPHGGENQYEGPNGHLYYPDGRNMDLWEPEGSEWRIYDAEGPVGMVNRLIDKGGGYYDLLLGDGGKVVFGPPSAFAQAIVDPYGQTTTLDRDASGKLTRVTEPGGRYLQITYQTFSYYNPSPSPGFWHYEDVISMVQAFDGRSSNPVETVTYGYTPSWVYARYYYNLTSVYYDDGAQAAYTYEHSNIRNGPNMGYWSTPDVVHSCDDVRYAGPMKQIEYEYVQWLDSTPDSVAWGQIKSEKNFNTHQVVSQVSWPGYPNLFQRTETRGDGATRQFYYGDPGVLDHYTDFKNQTTYLYPFTDARGNTTTTEYEPVLHAVQRIIHPPTFPGENSTIEYTFSDASKPYYHAGQKDENGNWTTFDRDSVNHRVTAIHYPDQSTEEFTYNGFGQVLTHKLRSGGTENFEYYSDNRGLKSKYWPPATPSDPNPQDHPTLYYYYTSGPNTDRLYMVIDPRGNATAYEYNLRGQVTKVQHQDGTYTQSGYNPDGTLAWTADENHPGAATDPNQRTRYTYDEYKRVLTVTNPMGETTTNCYAIDPQWANPLQHTTNSIKYTLSPMGKNVVFDYDANFRKIDQVVASGTADEAWTFFEYDEVGNLTKTTDPRSKVTTFGYDARNRKIWMDDPIASDRNSLGHTMSWVYDGVGNKTKETRADDAFRSWEYDIPNRITRAVDWRMSTAETAITTTYTRDVQDLTEWITDAKGAVYTFTFDKLHRKFSETYPPAAGNPNPAEYYIHDVAGNLFQYYDPTGHIKTMDYDNRNRLVDSWWNGGGGAMISYTYDAAGRMTSVVTGAGDTTVAFGYDNANRKIWEDQTVAGYSTHRVMSDLDADGNRENLQVPGAYLVHYDYTQHNQLSHIYQASGGVFFSFTYDAAGNMLKRKGEWGGVNDSTNCVYDALNRPTMWEQTGPSDVPFARSWYQYDNVSREVATWRDGPQDEAGTKGERFSFSTNNQVTSVKYKADQVWTATPLNAARTTDYTYTPDMLNRQSVTDNGVTSSYSANGLNQYGVIAGQALGYDSNFNVAAYNGGTYTYDSANYLISANNGSVQFTYDGLGRCVKRVINGVASVFVFDGWKPILEFDGAGNPQVWNIYGAGADEILLRITNSALLRYHADRQGNVAFILDGSGYGAEKYTYDAFGKPTITDWSGNGRTTSAVGNRFMYTGREWIVELGVYDYRHRMYHPGLGRFLQTDPTGLDAGDMNLFRYCGDDPVDHTDPTGLLRDQIYERQVWLYGCNFVGSFDEFEAKRNPAGMDGVGEGSGAKLVHAEYEEAKHDPAIKTVIKIWADPTVSASDGPITTTNTDGKTVQVQAKTAATLDFPSATCGPDGMIHVRQRMGLATVLPSNASDALRKEEMKRPEVFKQWIKDTVPTLIFKQQTTQYANPADAAKAVDAAVRPAFNTFRDIQRIRFDLKMKGEQQY